MDRVRAAVIHLALSVVVATALLALFWFVWYPAPLFAAIGGTHIFLMLLGVDVAIGPLLTLIVFKQGKKSLKFDLAVIALLQVSALSYGVITLLEGRPVYIAAVGHRFDVIRANEVSDSELATAQQTLPWFGPKWVGTKQAETREERERVMFSSMGGADYGHFPQHHQPLPNMRDELLKNAKPISELKKLNPNDGVEIDRWLSSHGVRGDNVLYQGLNSRTRDMAVVLDAKTADVVGIAPFKPWD